VALSDRGEKRAVKIISLEKDIQAQTFVKNLAEAFAPKLFSFRTDWLNLHKLQAEPLLTGIPL
jgi:hypothetical protein